MPECAQPGQRSRMYREHHGHITGNGPQGLQKEAQLAVIVHVARPMERRKRKGLRGIQSNASPHCILSGERSRKKGVECVNHRVADETYSIPRDPFVKQVVTGVSTRRE